MICIAGSKAAVGVGLGIAPQILDIAAHAIEAGAEALEAGVDIVDLAQQVLKIVAHVIAGLGAPVSIGLEGAPQALDIAAHTSEAGAVDLEASADVGLELVPQPLRLVVYGLQRIIAPRTVMLDTVVDTVHEFAPQALERFARLFAAA